MWMTNIIKNTIANHTDAISYWSSCIHLDPCIINLVSDCTQIHCKYKNKITTVSFLTICRKLGGEGKHGEICIWNRMLIQHIKGRAAKRMCVPWTHVIHSKSKADCWHTQRERGMRMEWNNTVLLIHVKGTLGWELVFIVRNGRMHTENAVRKAWILTDYD